MSDEIHIHLWGPPVVDWIGEVDGKAASPIASSLPLNHDRNTVYFHGQKGGLHLLKALLNETISGVTTNEDKDGIEIICGDPIDRDHKCAEESLEFSSEEAEHIRTIRMEETSEGEISRNVVEIVSDKSQPVKNHTLWKNFSNSPDPIYRMMGWIDREAGDYTLPEIDLKTAPHNILVLDDPGWKDQSAKTDKISQERKARQDASIENLKKSLCDKDRLGCILLKYNAQNNVTRNANITETRVYKSLIEAGLGFKTTVLTTVADLRNDDNVRIGTSLSWEQLFSDIYNTIKEKFFANPRGGIAQVIVSIDYCGIVIQNKNCATLIFHHSLQEGDFVNLPGNKGTILGKSTCMLAALVTDLAAMLQEDKQSLLQLMQSRVLQDPLTVAPFFINAARNGLLLMRRLHEIGYERTPCLKQPRFIFPAKKLGLELNECRYEALTTYDQSVPPEMTTKKKKRDRLSFGSFDYVPQSIAASGQFWTILEKKEEKEDRNESKNRAANSSRPPRITLEYLRFVSKNFKDRHRIYEQAKMVIEKGIENSLQNVPFENIGAWCSADRREIEGVRSVHNAIRNYIAGQTKLPLSLAVFGPPGAGKSYIVKEIARSLDFPAENILTYNLSQMQSPAELTHAFQEIRDLHLRGDKPPVVLWDEFDTPLDDKKLGWLRYFLAPMQDGEFMEHGKAHPVGRGIYAFAGGTCSCFSDFVREEMGDKEAKKPDFISRLRAHVDVKGPNGEPDSISDKHYVIRRATLLHSHLKRHAPHLAKKDGGFEMDSGVLNAFLRTVNYRHGARSMEAIILLSDLAGKQKFELSALPPDHILKLYVDARDFTERTRPGNSGRIRLGLLRADKKTSELSPVQKGNLDVCLEYTKETCGLTLALALIDAKDLAFAAEIRKRVGDGPTVRFIVVLPVAKAFYADDSKAFTKEITPELRSEYRWWINYAEVVVANVAPTWDIACEEARRITQSASDFDENDPIHKP